MRKALPQRLACSNIIVFFVCHASVTAPAKSKSLWMNILGCLDKSTTGEYYFQGQGQAVAVAVKSSDPVVMQRANDAVHSLLLERRGVEDFQIRNMASIIETATETQNTMTLLLDVFAVISLVLGGSR